MHTTCLISVVNHGISFHLMREPERSATTTFKSGTSSNFQHRASFTHHGSACTCNHDGEGIKIFTHHFLHLFHKPYRQKMTRARPSLQHLRRSSCEPWKHHLVNPNSRKRERRSHVLAYHGVVNWSQLVK